MIAHHVIQVLKYLRTLVTVLDKLNMRASLVDSGIPLIVPCHMS